MILSTREKDPHTKRILCLAALALLTVFHLVNNWMYLLVRVNVRGWDRPAHLVRTLIYNDILARVNVRTLFEALTWSWNRPPLRHLVAVPFYRLFGVSTDVALMSNSVFLVVLLWCVYGIGRRMYGRSVGLTAAFLVSTYPVLFGMSRLSYVDYALAAMVSLSIYLLVRCDRFRNRGFCLLLGLSFGLGVLTKWPFVAFVAAPVAYVIARSEMIPALKRALPARLAGIVGARLDPDRGRENRPAATGNKASRPYSARTLTWPRLIRSPAAHVLVGLVVNVLWYGPNWDRLPHFALDGWIFPLSWLLVSATLYVLSRPATVWSSCLSAFLIGGSIASLWSLPNIGFLGRFVEVAYGGVNIDARGLGVLDPSFYSRYVALMVDPQLSPLYFFAFLLALVVLVYPILRSSSRLAALRDLGDESWILLLWAFVPFLLFTFSLTLNARFDIALLPSLALITARGVLRVKSFVLKWALIYLLVVGGVVQFLAYSYDDLDWLRERAVVNVPARGEISLFARGGYIELPASGRTDPGYFVPPRVLEVVEQDMSADGSEQVQLGNLVNRTYSNNAIFNHLMYDAHADIELREFARAGWEAAPVYPKLFECDYLLLASGSHERLSQQALEALAVIERSPSFFQESFQQVWEWSVPDGDVLYLYKKRYHLREAYDTADYERMAEQISALAHAEDGIVLDPPAQVEVLGRYYTGQAAPYPLPKDTPMDREATSKELQGILSRHRRVWGVFWERSEVDPDHFVEHWLNQRGYRAWDAWYGPLQLVIYGSGTEDGEPEEEGSLEVKLGEVVVLQAYKLLDKQVGPGDIVRVSLDWQSEEEIGERYKVFVHLLDSEGRLVAQRDSEPVGGSRPTSTWAEGEEIADNYGVLVPEGTNAGEYRLVVGMYLPSTEERLPVHAESVETIDDGVLLGGVQVVAVE